MTLIDRVHIKRRLSTIPFCVPVIDWRLSTIQKSIQGVYMSSLDFPHPLCFSGVEDILSFPSPSFLFILDFPLSLLRISSSMTLMLENFVMAHPSVTLSHADYGSQYHVGRGVNIQTSPPQRLHHFVENDGSPDGSPYRFIIVGRLATFKIVEDSVRATLLFWSER